MALFSACKKKDVEKTTAEKILGKWNLVTEIGNDYYNNTNHIINYSGTANDAIDFRADGKAYEGPNFITSSPYSIVGDNKLLVAGFSFDIKTLTDAQLILFTKRLGTSTDFYEATSTYKR